MSSSLQDLICRVRGRVQGVGFRPFVRRLALSHGLEGWVRNDAAGVLLRARGQAACVEAFLRELRTRAPSLARVEAVERMDGPANALKTEPELQTKSEPSLQPASSAEAALPEALAAFPILESAATDGRLGTQVPTEAALCPECRRELRDASNRRHRYPFINCTQCGPRYSLLEAMPYDRERSSMRRFPLCAACRDEYLNPSSRRYHAEPIACPQCGPRLLFQHADNPLRAERQGWLERLKGAEARGAPTEGEEALAAALRVLQAGGLVAVKGLGGYHLMCDATRPEVIQNLRRRKQREEKPLALMFADLAQAEKQVAISEAERQLLLSPEAPIVLLRRLPECRLPAELAPQNPWLGVLLPYTPLHDLLLSAFGRPLVATSANLSEEPLCFEDEEARQRLRGLADAFLYHDRPILHPVDDSVVRLCSGDQALRLRLARGYAPLELELPGDLGDTLLCLGADMKASLAVAQGRRLVQGPHVGDLANTATQEAFEHCSRVLGTLFGLKPLRVACDLHPGYHSTRFAELSGLPMLRVQHHLAHFFSCLLEHRRQPAGVLGVIWDGTGYGADGEVWGGECLLGFEGRVERFAHLRPFALPGGDAAAHDPRRAAHAMYLELGDRPGLPDPKSWRGRLALSPAAISVMEQMITRGLNTTRCTSMGRLFDVVAWLLGAGVRNHFEAQLPLSLEALAARAAGASSSLASSAEELALPLRPSTRGAKWELDWAPCFSSLATSTRDPASLALGFHAALGQSVLELARRAGVSTVALSGGCFQNALLTELVCTPLQRAGFEVLRHRELPPGDGGVASGQALAALLEISTVSLPAAG